jgi:hypothetical protein
MPARKKSPRKSKPKLLRSKRNLRLTGVELYFEDLPRAKKFYSETLGLELAEESAGHFAQFGAGGSFVCVESKGSENYPSLDKAVLFFEVPDLAATVELLGPIASCAMSPRLNPDGHPGRCSTIPKVTTSSFSTHPIENPANVASS